MIMSLSLEEMQQNLYEEISTLMMDVASVSSTKKASELVRSSIELCHYGGFNLHKFISNHREVLKEIPAPYRASVVQDVDLSCNCLPLFRTLGMEWLVENDEFSIHYPSEE